ncbi:MAG: hypothetical protein AAF449_11445 [Myxococcota bacterium]
MNRTANEGGGATKQVDLQRANGDSYSFHRSGDGQGNVYRSLFTPTGSASSQRHVGEDGVDIQRDWYNVRGHGYQGHTEVSLSEGAASKTRTVTNPNGETSVRQKSWIKA